MIGIHYLYQLKYNIHQSQMYFRRYDRSNNENIHIQHISFVLQIIYKQLKCIE